MKKVDTLTQASGFCSWDMATQFAVPFPTNQPIANEVITRTIVPVDNPDLAANFILNNFKKSPGHNAVLISPNYGTVEVGFGQIDGDFMAVTVLVSN